MGGLPILPSQGMSDRISPGQAGWGWDGVALPLPQATSVCPSPWELPPPPRSAPYLFGQSGSSSSRTCSREAKAG